MIHWPDKNRYLETTTLCGQSIPKIQENHFGKFYKQDIDNVTSTLDKVDCVDCLRLRVKQLNGLIDKTIDRIEECQSNSTR